MADSDSDSVVALHEEIPVNSNHQIILNPESHYSDHATHSNSGSRHGHGSRRKPAKHHHRSRSKAESSFRDTNEYFELARQASLLSKGDAMSGSTINDRAKHVVVPQRENEIIDRGKGVDHTGQSSRFQWNKPFQNQKNKQAVDNQIGECTSSFNGLSGQRELEMSRHNAGPSGRFTGHAVDVDRKGKGKLGLGDCSGSQKSEGGVILNDSRDTRRRHGLNQRRRNYFTGKRKQRMDQPTLGGSSSVFGSPPNHGQKITTVNSSAEEERERDSCSEEYWSLEEPKLNNEESADQSANISQVESDEILARRLQEQFNQESQTFQVSDEEDDDAIIARALQEEDDFDVHNIMSFRRSRHEVNDRDRSMAHLYSQSHRFPFEGLPMQIPSRRRTQRRFSNPDMDYEMVLISQLRSGLSSSDMDIDTRLSLLEALEEAFDNRSDMDLTGDIYRGFPDDEYEILSALDEDNHQHSGATEGQINILPISTIKGERVEDACVICLEDPAAGDVMRHLPCMHKFHKECIDTWLRRKNACPVCKSAIT